MRSWWRATLVLLACLLAGCGTVGGQPAYVFTVSRTASAAGFGITQGQEFMIVLPAVPPAAQVVVSAKPGGVVANHGATTPRPGERALTFAARHAGNVSIGFRCPACAPGERDVVVPVRVWP